MIEGVGPLGSMRPFEMPLPAARPEAVTEGRSFKEVLNDSIGSVHRLQQEADQVLMRYARGEAGAVELNLAVRKAEIAVEALHQIREQLSNAFNEIQKMGV